jgi:phosphoribosylaminoimidazole-succinocarboxamide synthase
MALGGYTVKVVAEMAGVSVRTLHHYDRIGLLRPAATSAAGYRLYSDADLERLQQVMFFRELGFSLHDVKAIVDSPTFDRAKALRAHRRILVEQQGRLGRLVELVDQTIASIERGEPMDNRERFGAFDDARLNEYREEMRRGKVRDVYDLGEHLLLVASDRVSAFDVVLPTPIPGKGAILTQMSAFWFDRTRELAPNHLVTADVDRMPTELRRLRDDLPGRAMLGRKAERIDVECVARGYLAGSAWAEYRRAGTIGGEPAPAGMREGEELPEPLFTPTTKAESGHDLPMTYAEVEALVGRELAARMREVTLKVYGWARAFARERGIVIADTKLEFGLVDGELIVIDELLTPDSSRFWPADEYRVGQSQASFDKQYVRDFLEASGWDKQSPAPELPPEVVARTAEKYREAYRRLVGAEVVA